MDASEAGLEAPDQAAIASPKSPTLEQLVARQLATARAPLLGTDRDQRLPEGSPYKRADVMALLMTSSLLLPDGKRWQLGRVRPPRADRLEVADLPDDAVG